MIGIRRNVFSISDAPATVKLFLAFSKDTAAPHFGALRHRLSAW